MAEGTMPTGHMLRRGFSVLRQLVALRRRTFLLAVFGAAVYGVATVASSYVLGQVTDKIVIPRFERGHVATDVFLALIGLVLFPSLVLLNVLYQRRVEGPAEFAQSQIGAVSAVAHESFDGALVVKALGAEDLEAERFRQTSEILRDAKIKV